MANTLLCDGDCGNVYYEIDLNETCYKEMMCNNCMCTFIAEQEEGRENDSNRPLEP